jgi:hypothetical protein
VKPERTASEIQDTQEIRAPLAYRVWTADPRETQEKQAPEAPLALPLVRLVPLEMLDLPVPPALPQALPARPEPRDRPALLVSVVRKVR